jgi:hypothetical protein
MDKQQKIKHFWKLFADVRLKVTFWKDLPIEEAKDLINQLHESIWQINKGLEISIAPSSTENINYMQIYDDGSQEAMDASHEIFSLVPDYPNWFIFSDTPNTGESMPILEYCPPEERAEDSDADSFIDDVFILPIPVHDSGQEARFKLLIYPNQFSDHQSRTKLECLVPMLMGMTRYNALVDSIEFAPPINEVPQQAIPFVRSDLWINFMKQE